MSRILGLLYGAACYVVFLATFLYAIGFVADVSVLPRSINHGGLVVPAGNALLVNLLLLTFFALQHSGMARQAFKRWLTRGMPASIERSTYVLCASLVLALLFWQWRPIPVPIWTVEGNIGAAVLLGVSGVGWLLVLTSTFLINHFELFGLHQVLRAFKGRPAPAAGFRTPLLYKLVRHPIYLGFILAFWATPLMTIGHLLFAAATTGYILLGIMLEERDLIALFGDEYRRYRTRVPMLFPWRRLMPLRRPTPPRPAVQDGLQ
ncbi:methanethiol S-methyltransferase [Paracraurococcus ruber]|uniref:methanethiol S-methyltransferase n=1 Tax=Paracraurococcus ruber TaxID=77675 RepID=A0ABS1D3U1_9PROT|nr:methanethiol S-methyltransferase [Paracraurococcus ruber]MBK1661530.1 hypothetical protein [Paracraurococcus ruber]TDG29484.1 isoprenylcysteine carboxylmethyltransferase family protein [Paracraurococcus ruber]